MHCAWQVLGLSVRWDSEATASPRLHVPSPHPQSNLTSSSDTLIMAWLYWHGNGCTGMATQLQEERQKCQVDSPSPWLFLCFAATPSPLCTSNGLGTMGPASLISSSPHCPALHELVVLSPGLTSPGIPTWGDPYPPLLLPEQTPCLRGINLGD